MQNQNLNANIERALELIEEEYFQLKNSTERYSLREAIITRLEEMKQQGIEQVRRRESRTEESVLEEITNIVDSSSMEEPVYVITPLSTVKEIKDAYNIDVWEWIDIICDLEQIYRLSIDDKFDGDDAVIGDLIKAILIYGN